MNCAYKIAIRKTICPTKILVVIFVSFESYKVSVAQEEFR